MSQEILTSLEIDTIGEIMNISMGSAATAASTLLDNKVSITTPTVEIVPSEEFNIVQLEPAIAVEIRYVEGISGSNILILRQTDVRTILGQMMMQELDDSFVIDEMATSAICELMNQMMGSSATVLSCFLGRSINISTPVSVPIDKLEEFKQEHFPAKDNLLTIKFNIIIKDIMESEFVSVMDIDLAKEIINVSLNFDSGENAEGAMTPSTKPVTPGAQPVAAGASNTVPQAPPMPKAPTMQQGASSPQAEQAAMQPPPPGYGAPPAGYPQQPYYAYPPYGVPPQGYYPPQSGADPVKIHDYSYGDFGGDGTAGEAATNLDLVMNVPVVVTVELGRTKRKIKEILEFGQGTIVELDKQAGSQVEVIVNGQLIARGDVVVVDDNFSIRITEILKNRDAVGML